MSFHDMSYDYILSRQGRAVNDRYQFKTWLSRLKKSLILNFKFPLLKFLILG
jgi:hypothetical protein